MNTTWRLTLWAVFLALCGLLLWYNSYLPFSSCCWMFKVFCILLVPFFFFSLCDIISCSQKENPDVDFAPAIPDAGLFLLLIPCTVVWTFQLYLRLLTILQFIILVCILLSFLSESQAYIVANLMIAQSRTAKWLPQAFVHKFQQIINNWPTFALLIRYLSLSNKRHNLTLLTFQQLIEHYLPKIAARRVLFHRSFLLFKRLI